MILIALLTHLLVFSIPSNEITFTETSTLTVEVTGIKPATGNVILSLYNKAEGFPESAEATFHTASIPVKEGKVSIPLRNTPKGTYAIAFFHDANSNGKMDYNFVGLPKEGYGFSNDAMGSFGPPSFKAASFTYTGKEKVTMKVKYL
jgi:uncharacterized protein (DUF2141 family)